MTVKMIGSFLILKVTLVRCSWLVIFAGSLNVASWTVLGTEISYLSQF